MRVIRKVYRGVTLATKTGSLPNILLFALSVAGTAILALFLLEKILIALTY